MFDWVEDIWQQKDQRITDMLAEFTETAEIENEAN